MKSLLTITVVFWGFCVFADYPEKSSEFVEIDLGTRSSHRLGLVEGTETLETPTAHGRRFYTRTDPDKLCRFFHYDGAQIGSMVLGSTFLPYRRITLNLSGSELVETASKHRKYIKSIECVFYQEDHKRRMDESRLLDDVQRQLDQPSLNEVDTRVFRQAVELGLDLNQTGVYGVDALSAFVYRKNLDYVRKVLSDSGDINRRRRLNFTVLQLAVHVDAPDIFEYLLSQEARLDVVGYQDRDALDEIIMQKRWRLVAPIVETLNPEQRAKLLAALLQIKNVGDIPLCMVKDLVEIDPGLIHTKGLGGRTLLVIAVNAERFDFVSWLLDHGADPNEYSRSNYLPLESAIHFGRRDIIEVLLKHGASKNMVGSGGKQLYQLAADKGIAI